MLASLSLGAGCVDAVGYLGLGQVFVANMMGNTVLAGFVLGVAVGAAVVERDPENARRGGSSRGLSPPQKQCTP